MRDVLRRRMKLIGIASARNSSKAIMSARVVRRRFCGYVEPFFCYHTVCWRTT